MVAPKKKPAATQAAGKIEGTAVAATGSPLIVQILTVLGLLAVGVAYFRVIGSRGLRSAAKTGK
ncbi:MULTISPECIES: hypothetical protein [unclassified Arthrobacter]|uniref:hypothetical protein n=1 Tax=unclassified Arthrobacter TaxID=235627 RepID=UPI002E01B949|nr:MULTISPECIES: hypothetical protein [unclassified Arthrobacter]MEC5193343.1 hypothetical protein [Arthrobacter sp. MP_M4]MEC5204809.1 hypothetical protein [Arthrobacter sp. MP_M7]